jgi:hypothetical protein
MPLVTRKSSAEWQEIWLEKLEKACIAKGLEKPAMLGFLGFITRFLKPHSCHPANIPVEAVSSFLRQNSKSKKKALFCRDAMKFFYTNVVQSENHLRAIDGIRVKASAKRPPQKRK